MKLKKWLKPLMMVLIGRKKRPLFSKRPPICKTPQKNANTPLEPKNATKNAAKIETQEKITEEKEEEIPEIITEEIAQETPKEVPIPNERVFFKRLTRENLSVI